MPQIEIRIIWMGASSAQGNGDSLNNLAHRLEQHFAVQAKLCASLEALADKLPNKVDPAECLLLARSIYPTVKTAHEFEEKSIFPLLMALAPDDDHVQSALERLHSEHMEDESFADVLHEKLMTYAADWPASDAESLSWMLRGFFDGLRRHMAFERECLIPLFGSDWTHRA